MSVNVNGGALEFDAVINAEQFNKAIASIEKQLAGLTQTANTEASAIDRLVKKTTTALAAYTTFAAGSNFIQNIARVRGEFQQLEVAFTTMLGSKEKADKLLAEVTEFAATTPFELKQVADATRQLLAFGVSANDIKSTLRSLGDVSAGIGAPLGEIAYLFGTIKTQGVALTQDVRQFAQRGIPIYEELSKVLGVSVEKVGDFISAGKVGFPEIEKVFKGLTAEGSKFGGLMEAQSKTLVGLQSNLRDSIDQMFNELGKSTEGIFADIIRGATSLVQNYERVIDVIKAIAVTYGAYRAALILTNVVEAVSVQRKVALYTTGKALTAAQALQTAGTLTLTRVTKLLNLTMLANPYVAITTAVVGFVSALAFLGDRTSAQEKAQKELNKTNEKYNEDLEKLTGKTSELLSIINSETATVFSQVQAFTELKALYPEVLKNMDLLGFKTLAADDAQKRFNESIEKNKLEKLKDDSQKAQERVKELQASLKELESVNGQTGNALSTVNEQLEVAKEKSSLLTAELTKAEQAVWEANTTLEEQIKHYGKIKDGLTKQRSEIEKNLQKLKDMSVSAFDFRVTMENVNLSNLNKQIDDVTTKINALSGAGVNPIKDKAFFTKQKADAQAEIDKLDVNNKDFNKIKSEQTKIIREAEQQLEKFDTAVKRNSASTSANNKVQTELNNLLEQRKNLIKSLNDQILLTEDFGKSDNQKELDNINQKYDDLLKNITEYNKKVAAFKKQNPKSTAQQIGLDEILNLSNARARELNNATQKQQAELFKQSLEDQQQLFERFEQTKKDVGIEKARELYGAQAAEAEKFYNDLKLLQIALAPKIQLGIASEADMIKFEAVNNAVKAIEDKNAKDKIDRQAQEFSELLSATVTYNKQRAEINKKYDDLDATLRKNSTLDEYDERKKILDQSRQEELDALNSLMVRSSALYRKLNQDIISFTRSRLKQELKLLQEQLKKNTGLTPQQKADIQNTIDQYKSLLNSTNDIVQDFSKVGEGLSAIGNSFSTLSSSLEGVDDKLAGVLDTLSSIANIGASAASAVASFAAGDIIGGITNTISVIAGLFSLGKKAREERKRQEKEVEEFYTRIFTGEQEINRLYRERALEQIRINKLRIQGIADEKALLEAQKIQVKTNYDSVFAELQKLTAKVRRQLIGGISVFAGESLFGKSFQQLEELYLKGQLEGKAKELFEQLQRLKQEGVDIDKALEAAKQEAQELFTGTTADSISDAIINGFLEGKRGAADFASTFEDLMRQAMIQSLKFKYLEGPIKDFFEQFAAASESDGQLTDSEINTLQSTFNNIIGNAEQQFQQLQQIAGLGFNTSNSQTNSLTGAIKGITETQAELLAGQFGGLRLTALDILGVARQQLNALNAIQVNTGTSAIRLQTIIDKMIYYYETRGVKIF